MTKLILKNIKNRLLEEKIALETQLSELIQKGKRRSKMIFTDFGSQEDDNAAEVRVMGDKVSLEGDLEKTLAEVAKALEKVEEGDYGICEECGKKINHKRLAVFPAAVLCIDCKKKMRV